MPGELVVELGRLGGRARNDQRGAGLVDEDGVDLVDDGVRVAPLHHGVLGAGHVVAEVVETELGVGPIGDIGGIGGSLGHSILYVRSHPPHREAQEGMESSHPLRVT